MIYEISSTQNKTYKHIKSLQLKKNRLLNNEFVAEGIKSTDEAVSHCANVKLVAVSEQFFNSDGFSKLQIGNVDVYVVKDAVFDGLCLTKTPQGILSVIETRYADADFSQATLCVYCDGVNDPGNLGTIIRTSNAAGVDKIILSPNCVELYSPKTVRSAMGALFHADVLNGNIETLQKLQKSGFNIVTGALRTESKSYTNIDMTQKTVIVVGNEANGVSDEVIDVSDELAIIPMRESAESLNVAVAASVLIYEAVRQRSN